MDCHFSDVQHSLKSGQKPDSVSAHYMKKINYTSSHNNIYNCIPLKVVKQINTIGGIQ